MAILDITEYRVQAQDYDRRHMQMGQEPGVNQQLTIGAGSVASAAFNGATKFVRLASDAPCRVEFGGAPTAASTSRRLAAGLPEYFGVSPGMKVAVITTT